MDENVTLRVGAEADTLPPKMLAPLKDGPADGIAVDAADHEEARALYHQMVGWDEECRPTRAKPEELDLGWLGGELDCRIICRSRLQRDRRLASRCKRDLQGFSDWWKSYKGAGKATSGYIDFLRQNQCSRDLEIAATEV
ncbi:MAG: hypothetical protein JW918_18805 [Anaerolineae bacterium]|nr:hypothetical protein [Anaerolineae bacterium]